MSFLYLEKQKVRCTEEGFTLKEVKKIWNNDKTGKEKSYFNDVITGIYFLYKPQGIFWLKPIRERIDLVNKDYIKKSSWEDLILKDGVQALVSVYRDLSSTINERLIDGFRKNAGEILGMMENIPMEIIHRIAKGTTIIDEEGISRKVTIEKEIILPNINKWTEIMEAGLTLSKLIKQTEDNLRVEEKERSEEEALKRLYDGRTENTIEQEEIIL